MPWSIPLRAQDLVPSLKLREAGLADAQGVECSPGWKRPACRGSLVFTSTETNTEPLPHFTNVKSEGDHWQGPRHSSTVQCSLVGHSYLRGSFSLLLVSVRPFHRAVQCRSDAFCPLQDKENSAIQNEITGSGKTWVQREHSLQL